MTDFERDNIISAIMAKIGNAPLKEKSKLIIQYAEYLENIDFVCVDEINGHNNIKPFISQFSVNPDEVHCPFYKNKIKVLNVDFLLRNKTKFTYMYDIGLDTQIVSYINRYCIGKLNEELIKKILWLQVARDIESVVNMDAYITENFIKNEKFTKEMKESIYNFFLFLNLPLMKSKTAKKDAKNHLKEIIKKYKVNDGLFSTMTARYYLHYCMLLKIIYLKFKKMNVKDKIIELIKFQNEVTFTQDSMYFNIAINYWESKNNIPFFSKVQKNQKDIISIIKNMSWDLFHWSNTTLNFNPKVYNISDVYVPLFFTIDNRLYELIKILKLHCVAIDKTKHEVFPFYDTRILNKYFSQKELEKHLSYEKMKIRNQYRGTYDKKELATKLENELLELGLWK